MASSRCETQHSTCVVRKWAVCPQVFAKQQVYTDSSNFPPFQNKTQVHISNRSLCQADVVPQVFGSTFGRAGGTGWYSRSLASTQLESFCPMAREECIGKWCLPHIFRTYWTVVNQDQISLAFSEMGIRSSQVFITLHCIITFLINSDFHSV